MKKIIALAVAGAFVAPAMAADVTVSGSLSYRYVADDSANTADFVAVDNLITVAATSEMNNGMTVSASITMDAAADNATTGTSGDADQIVNNPINDGGDNISIAGSFGKLSIGDVSGGMDAYGDYSDVSPAFGEFGADGDDAAIALTPNLGVEGLSVTISATPEGDARNAEGTSYGLQYTMGGFSVYTGKDEAQAVANQMSSSGIKYSADGIMVAYESGQADASSSGKVEYKGVAATYTMGDLTFGYEMQEQTDDGTVDKDETVLSAVYTLGGGASVYVAKADDDKASTVVDKTAIGISYAF
jgi:hypothetical protein